MTALTLSQLGAAYKPSKDWSPRYSVCAPLDGGFAEPVADFRDRDTALEHAATLRAQGITVYTYDWDREPAHQIIDGGAA
jgi:hypothetical protein